MYKKYFVTESFLPPIDEYIEKIRTIWETKHLTNQGPNVIEFNNLLKEYFSIKYCEYVTNGTIALQLTLHALGIDAGEIITTPFTYVATTSAIMWQRCKPVFVDIDKETLCIDADKIEEKITVDTKAILAVHVFGVPCDVEKIEKIASRHNLKVIYDAAHAFGVKYKSKSIMSYGDASTCSFHATKLFHTIEGGAVILKEKDINDKLNLQMRFGHNMDDHNMLGINAKNSEFHAAMGVCNFKYIDEIIKKRKDAYGFYDKYLENKIQKPVFPNETEKNYSYYPVIFKSEEHLLKALSLLAIYEVYPRRYFYPSLNKISYIDGEKCPISENIAKRIMCLPLSVYIEEDIIKLISSIIIDP